MSKTIWESEDGSLVVSQYAGPAGPPDRRRLQFTLPVGTDVAHIGRTEAEDLLVALEVAIRGESPIAGVMGERFDDAATG